MDSELMNGVYSIAELNNARNNGHITPKHCGHVIKKTGKTCTHVPRFLTEGVWSCGIHRSKQNFQTFECSICLESCENEMVCYITPCNHKFHKKCMKRWLSSHSNCPLCRCNFNINTRRNSESIMMENLPQAAIDFVYEIDHRSGNSIQKFPVTVSDFCVYSRWVPSNVLCTIHDMEKIMDIAIQYLSYAPTTPPHLTSQTQQITYPSTSRGLVRVRLFPIN